MVQFELVPDRSVDNKKVHDLFRAVSALYVSPFDMIAKKKRQGALWWDIMIRADGIRFFCTVPEDWEKEIRIRMGQTWPLAAIEPVELKKTAIPETSTISEMKYRRSNMFALQIDRRLELEPLNTILSIANEMAPGDLARLSICTQPVSRLDWQEWAEKAHQEFRKGRTPRRNRLTKKYALVSAGEAVTNTLQSLSNSLDDLLGYDSHKPTRQMSDDLEKRMLTIDGQLSRGTLNKLRAPTFHASIRIATVSPDPQRQLLLNRSLGNSFIDLAADNELERHDIHSRFMPIHVRELNEHRLHWSTSVDWDKNTMTNEELGRLVELPTAALQDLHQERLETLDTRQLEVPAILRKGGLLLGGVPYKRQEIPVTFPIKDHDQLCLPTVVIGGMGSGKTKGFGCNRAVQFVKAGFSSVMIDPAKSEMWEVITKALPAPQRRRVLLGQDLISLDFREALHSPQARSRLAQIVLAFFDTHADEAGAQTQRFLRAAVMGMQTGQLGEILRIFRDKTYLQQTINAMGKESMHRITLQEYHDYSKERQATITAPILNRLDIILGDPYLEACMKTDKGIDMVKILEQRELCTVFDVPDRLNTREAKNLLINLICFKIDAAMGLRTADFPVSIVFDEPHQYLRSAKLWQNVAVEARKYRLSYSWLFHSWEQIPKDLAQIIRDAGPHYFLYPSSKQTYRGLLEEISPFGIEDGLHTKRHHAICALKVGDSRLTPFMCHMAPPPV